MTNLDTRPNPAVLTARGTMPVASLERAATALRSLPYGGVDEATLAMRLPPAVQATVSPVVAAFRWAAVLFGMIAAVTQANRGDLGVVAALAAVLFLTTWRTLRPIRLGADRWSDRLPAASDVVIVGVAVGATGALTSPFVFCTLATAVVAAFGWGLLAGAGAVTLGVVAMAGGAWVAGDPIRPLAGQGAVILASFVVTVALVGYARARLLEAERRRVSLAGQLDMLSEANDLLAVLNELARTLPRSLDLREAMSQTRDELRRTFEADVVALATVDDLTGEWVPQITDGCALRPSATTEALPRLLARAVGADGPLLVHALGGEGVAATSGSGLYTAVRSRGRTVGVLGLEHRDENHFGARHRRLIDGLADVLALTVDNARSFRRLRTLGADEERSRIARDLHDRLGQWLSYLSFELERIIATSEVRSEELERLYDDVQTAIDELRETLRQLRAEVTEDRSLEVVAAELISRFNDRAGDGATATFVVAEPGARLPVRVENELLRVLQEALSNVAKHAAASRVDVTWEVREGAGVLRVSDDGRGFDPQRGIRHSAYGLVGMRERADVIDARLEVESAPGLGTTITVRAGRLREEAAL